MIQKSLKKNAILSALKTVVNLVFPLIIFPYITRILGVEKIGAFNFSTSVINYYLLLASLGISTYAIREGIKYRNNKEEINRFASEMYTINMYSTFVTYAVLFLSVLFVNKLHEYLSIILLLSIEIFFVTLGKSWVFNIFEEFGKITVATIVFQIVSLVLIFAYVRNENDLLWYVVITVFAKIGTNIYYNCNTKKYCRVTFLRKTNVRVHIKPILILFATSIAATIYVNSDITILGFLTTDYYVGLYSVSSRIYTILKQLVLAVVVVMIPRSTYLFKHDMIHCQKLLNNLLEGLIVIGVPIMVGMCGFSKQIIYIVAGESYVKANVSLEILAFALVLAIISSFFANCILVPNGEEKIVLKATVISACANIVLNFILVPLYNVNAAAFTTLVSELIMVVCCGYYSLKIMKLKIGLKDVIGVTVGSCFIVGICYFCKGIIENIYLQVSVGVITSIGGYGMIQLLFRNSLIKEIVKPMWKKKSH